MIDVNLVFDGTPATSSSGSVGSAITVSRASTNVIDLLVARDIGGNIAAQELHVDILTAFTAGGSATLQISVDTSADNSTFYSLLLSQVIPVASLVVGANIFRYGVPLNQLLNGATPGRYLRLSYTVASGPMTAGTVLSYLTGGIDRQIQNYYARNYVAA
jgi:hypothetical protein